MLRFPDSRKATVGLDFKQLIAQATQPDDKGNKIPAGTTFGSLRVETADEQLNERIMVTTSIYDPVAGTCGGGCVICNGINSFYLSPNPVAGPLSNAQQVSATISWDDGNYTDVTLGTSFTSSNPSAISVINTPGTSGNGVVTFTAAGSGTITGRLFTNGEPEGEPPPECPTSCPRTLLSAPISARTQTPTSLSLNLANKVIYTGNDMIECNGTDDGPKFGYSRCATFTLKDQTGATISTGTFSASESVPTVSSNPAGLTAKTGGGFLVNGSFQDFWSFVGTSVAPAPGQFVKARQSITIQDVNNSLTYRNLRINCLDFESSDVTPTDITVSGTCQ